MSYDIDGYLDIYRERIRRARRKHRCDACKLPIHPGERYCSVFLVWKEEAIVDSVKRCGRCETIYRHLADLGRDWDRAPDERLHCGEDYEDEWGQPPPEQIQAVIFATSDEASRLMEAGS